MRTFLSKSGTLYCVAMPIGNPRDITLRALDILGQASLIACEDTRTAKEALGSLGIRPPRLLSYFEHNEEQRSAQILEVLQSGQDVALVSEAGTPTISDPGFRLVRACVEAGVHVVPIPGACAAVTAISASGLPTDRFLFVGFPPKKGGKFQRFLERWLMPGVTTVFYVPARKLEELITGVAARTPSADIVVARELTKTYEEFLRGKAADIMKLLAENPPRGECTVLVRPQEESEVEGDEEGSEG